MTDKISRVAAELAALRPDELDAVLSMTRLKTRVYLPTRYLVSPDEYLQNRSFLDAAEVGYEAGTGSLGHLLLPPDTRAWSYPTAFPPKGHAFVLAVTGDTERRRIVPL